MSEKKFSPEDALKLLRVCTGGRGCDGCPLEDTDCGNYNNEVIAAGAIEELLAQVRWIPVGERLPEVRASIWAQYLGTEQWEPWMNQQQSDYVEAVIAYDLGDGLKKKVHPAYIDDGEWRLPGGIRFPSHAKVERWRPMPEVPGEEG